MAVRPPPGARHRVTAQRADGWTAQTSDHRRERQPGGDDETGKDPENEDSAERDRRDDNRAGSQPSEAPEFVDPEEPCDGDYHDRPQCRLGEILEQRRQEGARKQDETGRDDRRQLRLPARPLGGHRLACAAGLDEPLRQPGNQVRAAERDEIAVGIYRIAVRARDAARNADGLGADHHEAERCTEKADGFGAGDVGPGQSRQGEGRSPTTSTP